MKVAIAFNTKSMKAGQITSAQYAQLVAAKQHEGIVLVSPLHADPLHFVPGHTNTSGGKRRPVAPHFKRASGHGSTAHVFDRDRKRPGIADALAQGKKILITLHGDLTNDDYTYDELNRDAAPIGNRRKARRGNDGHVVPFANWVAKCRANYITVPAHNAVEALRAIRTVATHCENKMGDHLHVLYQGGVLPYRHFYLGKRDKDLVSLYDLMKAGRDVIDIDAARHNKKTRLLGFPRLLRFMPTRTTLTDRGVRGLSGNFISRAAETEKGVDAVLCQLQFSDKGAKHSGEYQTLWRMLEEGKGVYVLATPFITMDQESDLRPRGEAPHGLAWQILHWSIHDIREQIATVGDKPQPVSQMELPKLRAS